MSYTFGKSQTTVLATLLCAGATLNAGLSFSSQSSTLQLSGASAKIILTTPLSGFDGTLKISDKTDTSLSGSTLSFANGVYQAGTGGRAFINATIDPNAPASDSIKLSSGQSIDVDNGSVLEGVLVLGTGNAIYGQPTFNSAVTLTDASTDVTISIQNKLNQNITMNGGKVILGDDLALQDGVFFSGDGTVDLASKTLTLPATPGVSTWSGALTFQNANDIELSGFTNLSGTWTFEGDAGTSVVNGNGNVLDISGGGTITIGANHTLYLSDVHVRGVGATGGDITLTDSSSMLIISNTVLELDGDFTLSTGTVKVTGNNCTIIAKGEDDFIIDGANTVLNVDGVALLYDPLGTAALTPNPFVTNNSGTITYTNGGTIRPSYGDTSGGGSIEFSNPTATKIEEMPSNQNLGPSSTVTFKSDDGVTPKSITLDGKGFYMQFNYTTGQYMIIEPEVTVHLTNILLKDFDPALVNFGTGASIVFGDGVSVSLANDLTISSRALAFEGNATLRGNNTSLHLTADSMLTATGDTKNLTVKNLKLFVTNATAMKCTLDTTKITLQDSELHMVAAGASFDTGSLDIKNTVSIFGGDPTSSTGSSTFSFASKGTMTVKTDSILRLENGASFSYAPITTDDADAAAKKRHFQLADPSATLWINGCSFTTSDAGFALDYGRLLVDGKTTFHINAADGAEVEFGSSLLVELAPSGILEIDGALKYTETTYP